MAKKFYVHPTADVSPKAEVGEGTKIWHQVQVREDAKIGKNCNIGKNVYIDFEVSIGNNVKIQNNVSVYNGVTIEDDVLIASATTFTNDLYPRTSVWSKERVLPTLVKKGATIGANATIVCGNTISEYATVGAGAVVTKDVPPHALVYGNPAKIHGFVCKCGWKSEKIKDKKDNVVIECPKCKETFEISSEVYALKE